MSWLGKVLKHLDASSLCVCLRRKVTARRQDKAGGSPKTMHKAAARVFPSASSMRSDKQVFEPPQGRLGRERSCSKTSSAAPAIRWLRSGAQRERKYDLRVAKIFPDAVIIRSVSHFNLREICSQSFRKPGRHIPQIKMVMNGDQKLYRLEWRVASIKYRISPSHASSVGMTKVLLGPKPTEF
jgi:hypothetical protein